MDFQLRKADRTDWDFIWALRVDTMKRVVSQSSGWDDDVQRTYAAESLNGEIVLVDGQAVGVLTLVDWGDQLHLAWMAVVPSFQRRGLGRALVGHCQRRAVEAGKPLTLQVLRANPAVRLYERCGFQVYRQSEPGRWLMRWTPSHRRPQA
jgi:ribosomal protein S18 acetylase RimI-like enzyme